MDPIRVVLAATDFSPDSQDAARRAARLAGSHRARLDLAHVLESDRWLRVRELVPVGIDLREAMAAQARIQLATLAQQLLDEGTVDAVHQHLLDGEPLRELQQQAADLLVVGARGSHRWRELALGTLADRLSRCTGRPLLVVRNPAPGDYRRVLVPVDFSPASLAALEQARRLAPGAACHLLHAFELPEEGRLRLAGVSDDDLAAWRARRREQAHERMGELLTALGDAGGITTLVREGDIRMVMLEVAQAEGCDLLALGKQGQSLLGDLFLGSVTAWALSHAQADVLVVPQPRQA